MKYNKNNYRRVFGDDPVSLEKLEASEKDPSLSQCVERWLERTPGLEEDGFNFPLKFKTAVEAIFKRDWETIEAETNEAMKTHLIANYKMKQHQFDTVFDEGLHQSLVNRGERRFSHKAMLGLIMITLYKEEPRFHQPSLLLEELINLEVELTKWRCKAADLVLGIGTYSEKSTVPNLADNHVLLVQRQLGSQQLGTGGSSGYQYLRSTLSDRYKVFLDLFNVSTFLIPRDDIPPLTDDMKTLLRTHSLSN